MIAGHLSGSSWLHRAPARLKLVLLAGLTLGLFFVRGPLPLVAGVIGALLVYAALGRPAVARLKLFRPLLPILIVIGLLQGVADGWAAAVTAVARLALMVLLADLVTMTTPMLDMMDAIAPLLAPLRVFGLDTRRISLAFALVIRFVPMLLDDWRRREEAWRARTGRRPTLRLIAPWIADLLRLADRVADSLDARGFRRH